ncbi:1-deoxypentalenic acid 11-beta-hydroxylase-like [Mya arenaria]|uniref:1-deoxypentalenic acid 11-beta-hydroxylase-like n=1 Tax=Mya arenaria TaxID=6604 RepID=UPI0022E2A918|nr:1-deoxypentalenic acid 11-beta-hydroxylase-like [Mya arenaria]
MPAIEVENGVVDEAHPEIFDPRAMPPQPKEKKPGQQPEHVIKEYFEKGYLVLPNFFTKEEMEPCRKTTEELVDNLAKKLFEAGKIKNAYENLDLFHRLTKLEEEFPGANVILHKVPNMPMGYRKLWANERLLNLMEQLIGPDIAGNPVWNLRTKTPQNEATTVPWHQDCGYLDNNSYKMLVPTAWVPMLDANEGNGCLQMAEGGHRSGRVALHRCCWGGTWYVELEPEEMKTKLGINLDQDIKTVPVPYGGLVLFNNLIPHRSLPNMSDNVRWSLDLRWQRSSDPDGLWGLKKPVVMRVKDKPDFEIDWTEFDSVDRHSQQKKSVEGDLETNEDPEFDTTLPGPWMKKWEIVHMNKHTDRHKRDEAMIA